MTIPEPRRQILEWWADRLVRDECGNPNAAFTTQALKLGAEYGEFLQEWMVHFGTNPRKPREERAEEMLKELCDIVISAEILVTMLLRYIRFDARKDDSGNTVVNRHRQSELHVLDRLLFVTARLRDFDERGGMSEG